MDRGKNNKKSLIFYTMKIHTTNYFNSFITIAEDSPTIKGIIPPYKGLKKSIANLQYEILAEHSYQYTSDDVFFTVFCIRNRIKKNEMMSQRESFFSKGQPCFRASPLTKKYGWGIHSNSDGKIALYDANSIEYKKLLDDDTVLKKKAMRSTRLKK